MVRTYVADRCQACRREHTLISDIRGHRTQEALVASDGALIPWTALNMHDDTFAHVRQFRFYQDTPGKARLTIIPAEGFGEKDRQRVLRNLERKLDGRLHLTLALTNGRELYAFQRGARFLVIERDRLSIEPVVPDAPHPPEVRYVLFATAEGEEIPPGYRTVPDAAVVSVDRDLRVTRHLPE